MGFAQYGMVSSFWNVVSLCLDFAENEEIHLSLILRSSIGIMAKSYHYTDTSTEIAGISYPS